MAEIIEKLKERWGVNSYGQVVLILFIFAITGFTALYVKGLLYSFLGITEQTHTLLKIALWVGTVVPAYQVIFLFYGFIFGQFEFVWQFEKKSFARIKNLFVRSEQAG